MILIIRILIVILIVRTPQFIALTNTVFKLFAVKGKGGGEATMAGTYPALNPPEYCWFNTLRALETSRPPE